MKYGIETKDGQRFEFIGEMSMSVGSGMAIDTRYGNDASKQPQGLTRRKRNQARTATVNITVYRANIFDEVQKYEILCGVVGELTWAGQDMGLWCVRDVSFSFSVDAVDVASSVQVSMSLSEGYIRRENTVRHEQYIVHLL